MSINPFKSFAVNSGAVVHLFMAFSLALSALAWAWHVDIPVSQSEQAQVATADHAHIDGDDLVDRCDHCCHAGAHLVALVPSTSDLAFATVFSFVFAIDAQLIPQKADPPYIPPIA